MRSAPGSPADGDRLRENSAGLRSRCPCALAYGTLFAAMCRMIRYTLYILVVSLIGCGSDVADSDRDSWDLTEPGASSEPTGSGDVGPSGSGEPEVPRNSGVGRGDGESSSEEIAAAVEAHCSRAIELSCRAFFDCDPPTYSPGTGILYNTVEQCMAWFGTFGRCSLAIASERENLDVDAQALDECAEASEEASCASSYWECVESAVRPVGEDGAECFTDVECVGGVCHGTWSREDLNEGACNLEAGVCGSPSQVGGTCEFRQDCAAGLNCVSGKCLTPGGEGAACASGEACRWNLTCTRGDNGQKRCTPRLEEGEPCDPHARGDGPARCEFDLWCDPDQEVCLPRLEVGESCAQISPESRDDSCASGACDYGVCVEIRLVNELCDDLHVCGDGLTCDDGVCRVDHARLGDSCTDDTECYASSWADLFCIDGMCDFPPDHGEPCHQAVRYDEPVCAFHTTCIEGTCVADWTRDACTMSDVSPYDLP